MEDEVAVEVGRSPFYLTVIRGYPYCDERKWLTCLAVDDCSTETALSVVVQQLSVVALLVVQAEAQGRGGELVAQ